MLESGTVTNMPMPKPKYPMPPNFTQPQEMVVDITVKIVQSNEIVTRKLKTLILLKS
jgi:hypothetical protein